MHRIQIILLFLLLIACKSKPVEESTPTVQQDTISTDSFKPVETHDYSELYGVYDHESNTKGFEAVVAVNQSGLNLSFTVSVTQGSCKTETEGIIVMMKHSEQYLLGFANVENCPLQFTFYPKEKKIDIKEVNVCTLHGPSCSYDGMYKKRNIER